MRLSFSSDEGVGAGGRFGLIVLQADETVEWELGRELRRRRGEEAVLYVARIAMADAVGVESLGEMAGRLRAAAALLPRVEAVGYGCTSGAAVIGAAAVGRAVREGAPAVGRVTDPLTALVAVCRESGVRRLAVVAPYVGEVADLMAAVLAREGIEVAVFGSFEEPSDAGVARISEESVRDAALRVGRAAAVDGLFISCTNLRTAGVLRGLEAELGMPVLSSNSVLGWALFGGGVV